MQSITSFLNQFDRVSKEPANSNQGGDFSKLAHRPVQEITASLRFSSTELNTQQISEGRLLTSSFSYQETAFSAKQSSVKIPTR